MRTVKINIEPDNYEAMSAHVGGYSKINDAIGYLSTWAMASPRYAFCSLWSHTETEITAVYREVEDGPVTYAICAIWHNDHWGFHS